MGIEPTWSAWEAGVLPLNYTRTPSVVGIITAVPDICQPLKSALRLVPVSVWLKSALRLVNDHSRFYKQSMNAPPVQREDKSAGEPCNDLKPPRMLS